MHSLRDKIMIHILHSYFKPGVGASKRQDKPLPDPNAYGLLFSTIPSAAIWDVNDAHTWSSEQIQGGERKRSWGSYVKLTPVQQAHIAKYTLANGNKVAILRYTKEFQAEIKTVPSACGKHNMYQNWSV